MFCNSDYNDVDLVDYAACICFIMGQLRETSIYLPALPHKF